MKSFLTVAIVLALLNGGWMLFDGSRALVVGDYVTPKSGAHAGQLGPWAAFLAKAGLDPRSAGVKIAFVVLGLATLVAVAGHFLGAAWARPTLLIVAVLGLWYLPFGTIINAVLLVALSLQR